MAKPGRPSYQRFGVDGDTVVLSAAGGDSVIVPLVDLRSLTLVAPEVAELATATHAWLVEAPDATLLAELAAAAQRALDRVREAEPPRWLLRHWLTQLPDQEGRRWGSRHPDWALARLLGLGLAALAGAFLVWLGENSLAAPDWCGVVGLTLFLGASGGAMWVLCGGAQEELEATSEPVRLSPTGANTAQVAIDRRREALQRATLYVDLTAPPPDTALSRAQAPDENAERGLSVSDGP